MNKIIDDTIKATREVQAMWENRTAQILDEFVKSQTFVNAMTTSLDGYLDVRKTFDTALGRWAETWGVVTKKDMDKVNQQIFDQNVRLEKILNQLSDIQDKLNKQAQQA
jgi:hypothetical protein